MLFPIAIHKDRGTSYGVLHRKVELVPEHELNRHIRERVMGEAVEL